ncbi:MAG: DUF6160 family protein [Smithellaceae bacterium]
MRGTSGLAAKKLIADPRFIYRQVLLVCFAVFVTVLLFILAAILSAVPSEAAGPVNLSDSELAGVTGQAGISVNVETKSRVDILEYSFSDTPDLEIDRHWIKFKHITVDDGAGGHYIAATTTDGPYDPTNLNRIDPIRLDVGTNDAGRTLVSVYDSSHVLPRWYAIEDFEFVDLSLGSINLDALSMGPSLYRAGAHADGTGGGFDFDYSTRITAQALRFTYNTALETLALSGIHLAGSATGAPEDPATWSFTGNFKIGDIDGGNPAKFDVVTNTDDAPGVTSLVVNVPMQGSLRVENVNFGGDNFGPIAIDGINVHRMSISFHP